MKKIVLLVTILLLIGTTRLGAADRRNFWLLNNTGYKINRVFLAIHGNGGSWSSDILGDTALPHGMGTVVYFHDGSNACVYDFRIVYTDGSSQDYLLGRNLCATHAIQFNEGTNDSF